MSRPAIAKCYDDVGEDPSLLQLFLEKKWMLIQEHPFLGDLQFRIISERLFTCIASPAMWGKAGVEFVTSNGQKISGWLPQRWSWLQMGWMKEIWAWWSPSVTTIKPRWRFLMHFLPYINVTCWSQVWLQWGGTQMLPISLKDLPVSFI